MPRLRSSTQVTSLVLPTSAALHHTRSRSPITRRPSMTVPTILRLRGGIAVATFDQCVCTESSNQSLQPTAGRSDKYLAHDFNIKLHSKARCRQRWLSSVSLDDSRASIED